LGAGDKGGQACKRCQRAPSKQTHVCCSHTPLLVLLSHLLPSQVNVQSAAAIDQKPLQALTTCGVTASAATATRQVTRTSRKALKPAITTSRAATGSSAVGQSAQCTRASASHATNATIIVVAVGGTAGDRGDQLPAATSCGLQGIATAKAGVASLAAPTPAGSADNHCDACIRRHHNVIGPRHCATCEGDKTHQE